MGEHTAKKVSVGETVGFHLGTAFDAFVSLGGRLYDEPVPGRHKAQAKR